MRPGLLAWALALLLLSASQAQAQGSTIRGAVRVDALQVLVGGLSPGPSVILILQSDVELRARLSLLRGAGEAAALGPLSVELLRATQQELLGEALIASEATRLSLASPSPSEVKRERQRFMLGLGSRDAVSRLLRTLGVSARELDAIVRRRLVVSGFLAANLAGTEDVTPAELRRVFDAGDHPFQGRPFDEVRDALAGYLAQRSLERAVARWVDGLKQRVPHRVPVPY